MNDATSYCLAHSHRHAILIGKRAVRVLERVKSRRCGSESASTHRQDVIDAAAALESGSREFGLARRWPLLAARYRKLAEDDAAWIALDADGFRVDGSSAK